MPSFDVTTLIDTENSLERHGLIVERVGTTIRANVEHLPCHSPFGYECGYHGPGPADLALSVLHALIPPPDPDEEEKLYLLDIEAFDEADADYSLWSTKAGADCLRVNRLAYAIHQRFKSEFIATMPREGGFIPIETIRAFIETERARIKDRETKAAQ